MRIRLIVKPGLFLYFLGFEIDSVHFSSQGGKRYESRDEAIEDIKKINEFTKYFYNLEIVNF